jgi:hypothetical protein
MEALAYLSTLTAELERGRDNKPNASTLETDRLLTIINFQSVPLPIIPLDPVTSFESKKKSATALFFCRQRYATAFSCSEVRSEGRREYWMWLRFAISFIE